MYIYIFINIHNAIQPPKKGSHQFFYFLGGYYRCWRTLGVCMVRPMPFTMSSRTARPWWLASLLTPSHMTAPERRALGWEMLVGANDAETTSGLFEKWDLRNMMSSFIKQSLSQYQTCCGCELFLNTATILDSTKLWLYRPILADDRMLDQKLSG